MKVTGKYKMDVQTISLNNKNEHIHLENTIYYLNNAEYVLLNMYQMYNIQTWTHLTHWGQDKLAVISKTIFLNNFCWK